MVLNIRKITLSVLGSAALIITLTVLYIMLPWLVADYNNSKNMRKLKRIVSEKSAEVDIYKIFTEHGFSKVYEAEIWTKSGIYLKFYPLHLDYNSETHLYVTQIGEFRIFCENQRLNFTNLTEKLIQKENVNVTQAFSSAHVTYKKLVEHRENNGAEAMNDLVEGCTIKSNVTVPEKPSENYYKYQH